MAGLTWRALHGVALAVAAGDHISSMVKSTQIRSEALADSFFRGDMFRNRLSANKNGVESALISASEFFILLK